MKLHELIKKFKGDRLRGDVVINNYIVELTKKDYPKIVIEISKFEDDSIHITNSDDTSFKEFFKHNKEYASAKVSEFYIQTVDNKYCMYIKGKIRNKERKEADGPED